MNKIQKIKSLIKRLHRYYRNRTRPIRAYFAMRHLWPNRIKKFERKARFISHMRYFGSYRLYREYMDWRRYQK